MLDSLFNKVLGLQTYNFIKKLLQHSYFPVNVANFLKTAFSVEHLRWLLLCLLEREEEERGKRGAKERKIFQMKEENENISFNFYLQVLLLVKTEMQIQLCKY